jgi:hypothetical protein
LVVNVNYSSFGLVQIDYDNKDAELSSSEDNREENVLLCARDSGCPARFQNHQYPKFLN